MVLLITPKRIIQGSHGHEGTEEVLKIDEALFVIKRVGKKPQSIFFRIKESLRKHEGSITHFEIPIRESTLLTEMDL
jgi:hypothetical protein